jgi:hypothetical protein
MLRQFSIGLAVCLLNIAISPSSATPRSGMAIPVLEWRLLGPMAGMSGVLLFGWSTAVMFEVLRKVRDR